MPGLVPDHDVEGQFEIIVGHLTSATWRSLWDALGMTVHTLKSLGLAPNAPDCLIWQVCQQQQVILLTANRNDDGPDSLAATIRDSGTLRSLPVFTLAHADRVQDSPAYAERVAESLMDALMNLDHLRGAGRIWLP